MDNYLIKMMYKKSSSDEIIEAKKNNTKLIQLT